MGGLELVDLEQADEQGRTQMMRAWLRSDMPRSGREEGVPRRPSRSLVGALLAALTVGAAACSSGGGSATTVTYNSATVQSDVSTVYQTLFNLANKDVNAKVAVIQGGASLKAAMSEALASSLSNSSAGATVHSATVVSASQCSSKKVPSPCAVVNYDINGTNGAPILPNNTGYASFQNGHWLVAKATICVLLGLFRQTEGKSGSAQGCAGY